MTPGRPPAADGHGVAELSPAEVKRALHRDGEIALLDVREAGEFSAGHPFLANSVPFSRFEPELLRLLPNSGVRVVLLDDGGSTRAAIAARIARGLDYGNVAVMAGGAEAWRAAGYGLFEGENVPSKTFGELLQELRHVPTVSAAMLDDRRRRGERIILLDGRPIDEHRRMCVPGSICLPNGDLAYRIGLAVPDATTPVVIHCAGRTRSILGAETLRNLGLANPVAALEDGTQGWSLAGLALEHGSERRIDAMPDAAAQTRQRVEARRLSGRWGVPRPDAATLHGWMRDPSRTTYLLDVRGPEEFAARPAAALQNAPGGQLVQATDRWLAVRGARVVLVDDTEIRAVVTAHWLRQMGWDAMALAGGNETWSDLISLPRQRTYSIDTPPPITSAELAAMRARSPEIAIFDLRPSGAFRERHIEGARWGVRHRLPRLTAGLVAGSPVILVAGDAGIAGLAAADLKTLGFAPRRLSGDPSGWTAAGLSTVASPTDPPDAERLDFAVFTHDRHAGNLAAMRDYLAWEKTLVGRLDRDERAIFKIA